MEISRIKESSFFEKKHDYLRVVEVIKNRIYRGEIKPGDCIKTENYLSVEFGVSKTAAKDALSMLKCEGYIYSIPKKGNFVCEKIFKPYAFYFDEMLEEDGVFDEVRIIKVDIIKASFDLSRKLTIPENRNVIYMKRAYAIDKKTKLIEEKYIPYSRGMPIVEISLGYGSKYCLITNKNLEQASTKKIKIKACNVSKELSRLLGIKEGDAILAIERKILNEKEIPIELCMLYFSELGNNGLNAVTSFI